VRVEIEVTARTARRRPDWPPEPVWKATIREEIGRRVVDAVEGWGDEIGWQAVEMLARHEGRECQWCRKPLLTTTTDECVACHENGRRFEASLYGAMGLMRAMSLPVSVSNMGEGCFAITFVEVDGEVVEAYGPDGTLPASDDGPWWVRRHSLGGTTMLAEAVSLHALVDTMTAAWLAAGRPVPTPRGDVVRTAE
jgi:hypothetical protein